jgi:hypothetical protein
MHSAYVRFIAQDLDYPNKLGPWTSVLHHQHDHRHPGDALPYWFVWRKLPEATTVLSDRWTNA